ncbi:MAG: permease prefix domain 1-containing protein [Bryobacteraceae bacterium]
MGLIRRTRALFKRNRLASELKEELRFHLDMREQANANNGMLPEEARLDAARRFGNATLVKERTHDIDFMTFLETAGQDIRFALRMLMKHPGFTAIAVLALAVGIGVNTAVFTAYKAVLLQPLDATNPRELVNIYHTGQQDRYGERFSYVPPDWCGLLIRGSMRSVRINPGYETKRVISLNLNFPRGFGYSHAKQFAEVRQLRDRICPLAGVKFVASANPPDGGGLRTQRSP